MKNLILCGGEGSRLWPLSRKEYPKQFLKLGSEKTLLQRTIDRMKNICSFEDIFLLSGNSYSEIIHAQHPEFSKKQLLLEPEPRNTLPVLLYAIKQLQEKGSLDENELLIICPSDHLITPVTSFIETVRLGVEIANKGKIVTFGVSPTKPDTGYGYILIDKEQQIASGFSVKKFIEKPDAATAEGYLSSGLHLWNSGIFLCSVGTFLRESFKYLPEAKEYFEGRIDFMELPKISIDYGVLEKSETLSVVPLDLHWSDVGSFDQVYDDLLVEHGSELSFGSVINVDSESTLVIGGKKLIATVGLKDLIIVDSDDALLIVKRGETQKVKEVVNQLVRNKNRRQ